MEKQIETIASLVKRVTLKEKEKDEMRSFLLSYMRLKPVRHEVRLQFFSIHSLQSLMPRAVPVALVVILLATSVTFAAGGALPGEALYGVKIHVLEKVQTAVAVGSEAEVKVQASLAQKRLKEAEKLALRGTLNTETKTQIEEQFKVHTGKIESTLEAIVAQGDTNAAVEVSSALEASLETHGNILEKLGETAEPGVKSDIEILVSEVREAVKRVAAPSEKVEEQITKETDESVARGTVETKKTAARTALTDAETFFEKKRALFTLETQESVAGQLKSAEDTMAAGEEQSAEKKFIEAYRSFRQAQSLAHEALVALQVALELNLEVQIGTATSTPPSSGNGNASSTPDTGTSTPPSGTGTTTESGESSTSTPVKSLDILDAVRLLGK